MPRSAKDQVGLVFCANRNTLLIETIRAVNKTSIAFSCNFKLCCLLSYSCLQEQWSRIDESIIEGFRQNENRNQKQQLQVSA